LGSWQSDRRRSTLRVVAVGLVGIGVVLWGAALQNPAMAAGGYPVSALRFWQDAHGLDASTRLVAPDIVGNYLEAAYGGTVKTFLDDRAELFDHTFMTRALTLYDATPDALEQLARFRETYGVQGILWYRDRPLGLALSLSPDWRIVYTDSRWILAEPR
jgi:hypothetical protein